MVTRLCSRIPGNNLPSGLPYLARFSSSRSNILVLSSAGHAVSLISPLYYLSLERVLISSTVEIPSAYSGSKDCGSNRQGYMPTCLQLQDPRDHDLYQSPDSLHALLVTVHRGIWC